MMSSSSAENVLAEGFGIIPLSRSDRTPFPFPVTYFALSSPPIALLVIG